MIREETEVDPLVSLCAQNFSYSRLKTFDECALRYFYQYIIKVDQTYGMAADLGNIIHTALENSMKSGYNFEARELFENYQMAIGEKDPEGRIPESMIEAGTVMLQDYLATNDRAADFDHEPVLGEDYYAELPFSVFIGRGRFNGFIDSVVVKPKSVTITDYKCVTADTKFWDPYGYPTTIDELEVGDRVWGWNEDTGMHLTEIQEIHVNGVVPVVEVKTLNGRSMKVSRNHPVLTERGWVNAGDLEITDYIHVGLNMTAAAPEPPETSLPDPSVMADMLREGSFEGYKMFRDHLLIFDKDYRIALFQAFFNGKYARTVLNREIGCDLQTVLAQMGINSRVYLSMGSWYVEISKDSKMSMLWIQSEGKLPKNFTAIDKVVGVYPVGSIPTWAVTVDENHTHITDGLVTHNSGKNEVATKRIAEDLQLGVYSLVADRMFPGRTVHAELYYLRSGNRKGLTFTREALDEVEVKLTQKVETVLEATNFPATSNERTCNWCSYAKDGTCSIGQNRLKRKGLIGDYFE